MKSISLKTIYLDNNSTTSVDPRVLSSMLPFFSNFFGNASSSHQLGIGAKKIIEYGHESVATLIGADSRDIIFTSGATEAINMALKGICNSHKETKKHIITVSTEHKAVLETFHYLETIGFEVDYLPIDKKGILNLNLLKSCIKSNTLLISIMWVNNETGVIHPIKEIGEIARAAGVYFICDGTQGIGKLPIRMVDSNIDILCFSSHKIYGPKGIGAIYINPHLVKTNRLQPLIHGGGQENGLRSGTQNVPLIAGLGKAFEIAQEEMEENRKHIEKLRYALEEELLKIEGAYINGKTAERIYNTVNVCIPGFDTEVFIGMNKDIAVSNGSACNAALVQPSHVLLAMGLSNEDAMSSIRISLGKENTKEDISILIERIHNFMAIR